MTPLNADVIAAIMDITTFPNGAATINSNHNLNPQQIKFLAAKFVGSTNEPGVGPDLVCRDRWGHPYIISMDLNGDTRCRDAFYRRHLVSRANDALGFNGLMNGSNTNGMSDLFERQESVMVWSLGPDGKADITKPANVAPNRDNILSWK